MRYTKTMPSPRGWVGSLCLTLALLACVIPARAQGEAKADERPSFTIQGQGEVTVKPDVARVQVGVRTEAKEVTAAVQANATRMDAVLKAIRAAGVEEKDITTTNYSISPLYEQVRPNTGTQPAVRGYQVMNMVRVTVRKIGDAGKVLDAATQAGANAARGISFDLSEEEREKAYSEALTRAVKEAQRKAGIIGKAVGTTQVSLFSIMEQSMGGPPMPMASFAEARGGDVQTPVVAGQMTVSAMVTARFLFYGSAPNP